MVQLFFRSVRQGLRTGVYGGPVGQLVAVTLFIGLLWVGVGLAQGFITIDELTSDPGPTLQKLVEPTIRPIVDRFSGDAGTGG